MKPESTATGDDLMDQQLPAPHLEEVRLQDYLNVIRRRRRTFWGCFLGISAAVALITFCESPLYESTATLLVKEDKGKAGHLEDLLANSAASVDSELEILKSRSNAEKVVAALHLDWKVDERSEGLRFKARQFSSTAQVPVYTVQLTGGGNYAVRDDDGTPVGSGTSGTVMHGRQLTLLLDDLQGNRGDSFQISQLPFEATAEELRKAIKAEAVGKKTNVISVTYRNHNPYLARDVVNTLVRAYLDQGIAIKAEEATRTVAFVEEQLKGVKAELEAAERNLEQYKKSTGVVQLDTEAQSIITTLAGVEKQQAEMTLQRKQTEFALASLKGARQRGSIYSPALLRDDPLVSGMATRLAELEIQKKGLLSDSTERHPGVKSVQAQIDELQDKIQATYENSLQGLGTQQENIARRIAEKDLQLKRLPVAERDLARMMRVAKVNADIYTFLLQKHEEARIAEASTISSIVVVDPAIAAGTPVTPNTRKNLLLGLMAGAMAGVFLCFFREYLDDTLKDPEEAKHQLRLPLLALIPYPAAKQGGAALLSHHAPKSPASEAFRSLRTALRALALQQQNQVILVTSALTGEGKSTVACNLAITLAQTGSRVLIVDCDLRRSRLHHKFGMEGGEGMSELLASGLSHEAVRQPTAVPGLDLISSGAAPHNPAELLGSPQMARFLEQARASYSHIVVDVPPVLAVTDASVVASLADMVLLVVEMGQVPARAAQRTREVLATIAAPVAGIVAVEGRRYAGGYGYGSGYGIGMEKRGWRPAL